MRHASGHPEHAGFTLLETLVAASLLVVIVVAVTGAMTAGHQHSLEAQQRITATLAAESLLGRVGSEPYDDLEDWDGHLEPVGAMTDLQGTPLPGAFRFAGRRVEVDALEQTVPELGVLVAGRAVTVESFNQDGRMLARLERFIPEPAP